MQTVHVAIAAVVHRALNAPLLPPTWHRTSALLQLESELHTAAALQAHVSRLDDHLMKCQKERGQAMQEAQVRMERRSWVAGGAGWVGNG